MANSEAANEHSVSAKGGRLRGAVKGRPLPILLILLIVFVEAINALPKPVKEALPNALEGAMELVRSPVQGVQLWLFDSYQKISPREVVAQPTTIVAIDEKSLAEFGQWPWPRDRLANIINQIDLYAPAAIGLDIYMPEPDQNSLINLTSRLAPEQKYLIRELESLPSSDFLLSMSLSSTPSILGAAGFGFDAYTTAEDIFTVDIETLGSDPVPHIENYPSVLASLPEFQQAAAGQAILSVPAVAGAIRTVPLIAAINDRPVPGLAMEMLRVAIGARAIEVEATDWGVERVMLADLSIETESTSDVWLHYAPLSATANRYLSVSDLMSGNFDPSLLQSKLVVIGLIGAGLTDMRFTALGEQVPGVEIQAQLMDSIFEDSLLDRPGFLPWLELSSIVLIGAVLIGFAPRHDSLIGGVIKHRPIWMLAFAAVFSLITLGLGFYLFSVHGILFASTSIIIGVGLVLGIFFVQTVLDNLTESQTRLARVVENGISMGRAQQRDTLFAMTLDGMFEMAPSQAAVILFKSDSGPMTAVAQRGLAEPWTTEIDLETGSERYRLLYQATQQRDIQKVDQANDPVLKADHWSSLRTATGDTPQSLLVVPMVLSDDSVPGAVVLINAVDPLTQHVDHFERKSVRYVEALATQTAVAIENQNLVQAQKNMMDAMIQMIAGAIDAKSPYTGGHCERVPELATLLCEAAGEKKEGPLAEFGFTSEDEWREFKIAAWLHDCGKVTTPEHVVDKATKLETINNRIHEVRTRFEVLLRDAQIRRMTQIYEQNVPRESADAEYESRKAELIEDFEFIATCNEGGEFLSEDRIERIYQIANQTWLRHFNNRIGLSQDEFRRYSPLEEEEVLPVEEALLSDRPEHLVERPPLKALDEKFGFKMKVPEYLYNHGELHNLIVSRGTLTEEERFKINEHIIQTIAILEQMPFPPNMSRVVEIAGGHHETLIGTGYPRKLTKEELSIPARIMAIADIFEALTASDRPYKKAKTLSESIRILSFFKKDQHIDPDLFDLFLTSGIYKTYAERFLSPDQIDEVEIEQYLG